jgi:hypothetical protein
MHVDDIALNRVSERIIGCAFTVLNTLGTGFLEKVYENALAHELRKAGLAVLHDLLVEGAVLVGLKAVRALDDIHRAQCLNYLKATGLHLCLLVNFGKTRLEVKRIVLCL